MAQKKKNSAAGSKKNNKSKSRTQNQKAARNSLFNNEHKQILSFIGFFFALFMGAVVFINAGGLWGVLRNFFFGLFGCIAFVVPFFILFISVVSALGRDSREYKFRVAESFVIFLLIVTFLHIVKVDADLSYSEQLTVGYKTFKEYNGTGTHYGYGVFGALIGGVPLLLTGGNKLAAGIVTVLVLVALLMLFTGTTLIKLIQSLKAPAEVVSEYAEEKLDDIKETYEAVSENVHEKQKREKRRHKRHDEDEKDEDSDLVPLAEEHEIDLDTPLDDDDVFYEDVGVEPILGDEEPQRVEAEDILNLLTEKDTPSTDDLKKIANTQSEEILHEVIADTASAAALSNDANNGEVIKENSEAKEEQIEVKEEKKYELPPIDCLDKPKSSGKTGNGAELREKGETIVKTLKSFGVGTHIVEICQSPSVTRFELQPDPGVKISKITALSDDIAMNLAASGVRIEAPIPNKNAVGIEVPNAEKAMVTLREIIESEPFRKSKSKLNVALGRDIQGEATCADLAKMPHLLVAGTTGSGKSVCLNTMIMSLLYNSTPEEVKLIMIDPKKVEFTVYKNIPHLLVPVVADPRKAAGALSWAVSEMDKRYALFADSGVRNLQGYNAYAVSQGLPKIPQIVIIIDELSDLMMAASNEVEDSICRLAQKARAAGMHLIVATQRPSVDVITGLIKANIPSRIAFAVKSSIDSRTIIDTQGAEKLLGNGDMLFCPVGLSKPVRVQGCFVSDDEIERVIEFITSQSDTEYDDAVMQEIEINAAQNGKKKSGAEINVDAGNQGYDDEMVPKAIEVVVEAGMASTTLLQRKLKLGYARAARIVDELCEKGIIGPFEGSKPRKVLITKDQWMQMQANSTMSVPKQLSVDDIVAEKTHNDDTEESTVDTVDHNYFGSAINDSEE